MTSKTITDIITVRTASVHRGTGAVTTTHGTGTHGHITALGDSTDGITTTIGIMTAGTTEDSTTLGTTEVRGDSMILGIMADGMAIHTMPAGMED